MLISSGSPLVLLAVALVGMVGCSSAALWLWLRLRRAPGPIAEARGSAPGPMSTPSPSTPEPEPEPEPGADRTEFIPSPLALARAGRAPGPHTEPGTEPAPERTVFLPAEFEVEPGPLPPSAEPTLPGFAPASGDLVPEVPGAAPELESERTMFVAPSFGEPE